MVIRILRVSPRVVHIVFKFSESYQIVPVNTLKEIIGSEIERTDSNLRILKGLLNDTLALQSIGFCHGNISMDSLILLKNGQGIADSHKKLAENLPCSSLLSGFGMALLTSASQLFRRGIVSNPGF